jgi:hypothetical protein
MWSVIRKSKSRKALRRKGLGRFERLESRWCPAAPSITSFAADVGPGHSVTLSGQVSDENPSMVMIQFTGAVTATVFTNSQGQFTYTTQNCQLGTVTAKARDMEMLWSQPVTADITSDAPQIVNLSVVESGPNRQVTISGNVIDEDKYGLWVSVTGKVTANGVTDENGDFSITATATALGDVTVTVVDPWGLQGTAVGTITSNAPSITNLYVENYGNNRYQIVGFVSDEFPVGLTVYFDGVLAGKTGTVNEAGFFDEYFIITDRGEASVIVYDWWGIPSELVLFEIE